MRCVSSDDAALQRFARALGMMVKMPFPIASSPGASVSPVTVFAALGPNPAPLVELVWALHQYRHLVVTDLFLVLDKRGQDYLHKEVLGPGRAFEELSALVGNPIALEKIREHVVVATGEAANDDDPAFAESYNAAIWKAARDATAQAGHGAVVFGLTAGRRRTMTAMSTMAFQLLARPQDICVDVRVTDKRAEGGSGFFFPQQRRQDLTSKAGEVFAAHDVGVNLVDVQLPRLRGLLADDSLETYAFALAAGQAAVNAVAIPQLSIDLAKGEAQVDGITLPLSHSELIWYAALAHARRAGDGWVATSDLSPLKIVTAACGAWSDAVKSNPLKKLLGDNTLYTKKDAEAELLADLAKLKADTRKRMKAWSTKHRPSCAPLLVPEDKRWKVDGALAFHQRLVLDKGHIEIVGLPAA